MDARVVLAGLLACVLTTVLTPAAHWPRLVGEAALVLAAHIALSRWRVGERMPWRLLLGRFLLLGPFLILAAISIPASEPTGATDALSRAGMAIGRAAIVCGALAAAARAVETPELLTALARMRVPPIFVTVAALMLRYLGLLEGEANRMMRARDLRGTPPTLRMRARVAGHMVGALFLRSLERSERVSVAMQARGFSGLLPRPSARALARGDWTLMGSLLLAQVILLGGT